MQAILTILLIFESFKLTINYLNYSKVIRIDIKSNSEDNNDLYVHIISDILFGLPLALGKFEHLWMKVPCLFQGVTRNGSVLDPPWLDSDELKNAFFKCLYQNGMKAKDMFDNNLIQSYHGYYGYSTDMEIIENSSMVNSYYFNDINRDNGLNMNLFSSFKLRKNHLQQKYETNSVLFKILIKKWINLEQLNSDLTLSLYNTLKSCETFVKSSNSIYLNQDLLFHKVLHKYLKPPHGMCDDYDNEDNRPFNATNQWHCYRQCLKSFAQKQFKCKPVFIDNTIHYITIIYQMII